MTTKKKKTANYNRILFLLIILAGFISITKISIAQSFNVSVSAHVSETTIEMSGTTSSNALVYIYEDKGLLATQQADSNGIFDYISPGLDPNDHVFDLFALGTNNLYSPTQEFDVNLTAMTRTIIANINLIIPTPISNVTPTPKSGATSYNGVNVQSPGTNNSFQLSNPIHVNYNPFVLNGSGTNILSSTFAHIESFIDEDLWFVPIFIIILVLLLWMECRKLEYQFELSEIGLTRKKHSKKYRHKRK